jgi:hypothetical protein
MEPIVCILVIVKQKRHIPTSFVFHNIFMHQQYSTLVLEIVPVPNKLGKIPLSSNLMATHNAFTNLYKDIWEMSPVTGENNPTFLGNFRIFLPYT